MIHFFTLLLWCKITSYGQNRGPAVFQLLAVLALYSWFSCIRTSVKTHTKRVVSLGGDFRAKIDIEVEGMGGCQMEE